MRLTNTTTFELHEFFDSQIPKYAILSHRWSSEEESYQDFLVGQGANRQCDIKIRNFCARSKIRYKLDWGWIDTCCIDKKSSAELTEAINSMYRWYQNASVCTVYLSDVKDVKDFPRSEWFNRGWTLQELLGPALVEFYNQGWIFLGDRNALGDLLHGATGIRKKMFINEKNSRTQRSCVALESFRRQPLREACIVEKMYWASKRKTSRIEDTAYCLLGLFDVNMPLLYGEGQKAFRRLQEEILRVSGDETIFAWAGDSSSLLAPSPSRFLNAQLIRRLKYSDPGAEVLYRRKPSTTTNKGLLIETVILSFDLKDQGPCVCVPLCIGANTSLGVSLPLVLFVEQGKHGLDRNVFHRHLRHNGPQSPSRLEWDIALQGDPRTSVDERLSKLPTREILINRRSDMAWINLSKKVVLDTS